MERRRFCRLVGGSLGVAAAGCRSLSRIQPAKKPNIILIVTDDQGYADAGFRAGEIATPHIDRLVREGAELKRFYTCPVCSPTRAGLLTGRYPIRFGMQRAVNRPFSNIGIPAQEETLPELLGRSGYRQRHMIGKWHLGNMKWEHLPLRQGFTSFYGAYNSGIDYFKHTRMGENDFHRNDRSVFEEGYYTDLLSDEAVKIIESHKSDRDPFFIYLPYGAPHVPLQAPADEVARYRHLGKDRAVFAAMISVVDAGIGRILESLVRTGQDHNTLIFFCSDNGGNRYGNNSPLRGGKATLYEGGIRVLAAARWPGKIPAASVVDEPCSYLDILPTFCAVAGNGGINSNPLDGLNVMPLWQGAENYNPDWRFFSFFERQRREGELLSMNEENWKLIRSGYPLLSNPGAGYREEISLYNLADDISETMDLAKRFPKRVHRMLDELIEFRKLRPAIRGVPPMVEPVPEGWKPPTNWEIKKEK